MTEEIALYILGCLITTNLLLSWADTNFAVHLLKSLRLVDQDIFLKEELDEYVTNNWGTFGELLVCPICLATHLSWITALAIWFIAETNPWMILAETLSWPGIAYIILRFAHR